MKALLLRVGIDMGSGGARGPVFVDGSFEYIPIPESKPSTERRTYASIVGRSGRRLANFVPRSLADAHPHFDPEFEGFTYGDPTPTKREQLRRLAAGDILVFYAGLQPVPVVDKPRLFAIGYFVVDVVSCREHGALTTADQKKLASNAHFRRTDAESALVVVKGSPGASRLLSRAIPLGDLDDMVLSDVGTLIGYRGSLRRAIGHWVDASQAIQNLQAWLDDGPASLVRPGTRLFTYVVASDSGFAPNPEGSYCSLATCKPKIRKAARPGDWVMGTCPTRLGANRLVFLMRVEETMSFGEYYADKRFECKRPTRTNDGDNIYELRDGSLAQIENPHHKVDSVAHDISVNKVLISTLFWYFGKEAPALPDELAASVVKRGPGHRTALDENSILKVVDWVSSHYRVGKHGVPHDSGFKRVNTRL